MREYATLSIKIQTWSAESVENSVSIWLDRNFDCSYAKGCICIYHKLFMERPVFIADLPINRSIGKVSLIMVKLRMPKDFWDMKLLNSL